MSTSNEMCDVFFFDKCQGNKFAFFPFYCNVKNSCNQQKIRSKINLTQLLPNGEIWCCSLLKPWHKLILIEMVFMTKKTYAATYRCLRRLQKIQMTMIPIASTTVKRRLLGPLLQLELLRNARGQIPRVRQVRGFGPTLKQR